MNAHISNNNSWANANHYIHNTATDTITTPADIYANDTTATVGLKGQMEQSGTPSPDNPIIPSECGDMSGNLCEDFVSTSYGGSLVSASGTIEASGAYKVWYAKVTAGETYTISRFNSVYAFYANKPIEGSTSTDGERHFAGDVQSYTLTIPSGVGYLAVRTNFDGDIPMINSGSSPLPYEPYGQYKIPILSNSTTTTVYLGEVQTTRKVKKLVLTGEEASWGYNAQSKFFYLSTITPDYLKLKDTITSFCSHYKSVAQTIDAASLNNNEQSFWYAETVQRLYIKDTNYTSITSLKQYLADQYAAGTPVTVWYVLATEETGIVNEPLRKIGTYADEVSGITIPTVARANTLSVDTTLQPSEITVKYKGWHPVADVHERESGAWT